VSIEDKRYIAEKYLKDPSARKATDTTISMVARMGLRFDTHPRKVNVYRLVTANGIPVTRKDRTEVHYTADEMYASVQLASEKKGKVTPADIEQAQWFMHAKKAEQDD